MRDRNPVSQTSEENYMIYIALLGAMIAGRVVAGVANMILYGVQGEGYSLQMFMAGMFLNAVPGIVLQLVLIPVIVIRWVERR